MFPIGYVIKKKALPVVSDADAQAFVNAALIYNTTQANAINDFVIGLKADSIWTPLNAIYPFVGGNAYAHKFNLKNPVDSDAAFRLSFSSGWTHNASGAKGNGTSAYADTFLTPSVTLSLNSASMWVYYTTADTSGNYTGAKLSSSTTYFMLRAGTNPAQKDCWVNDAGGSDFASANPSTGFLGITRDSSSTARRYIGNTSETAPRTSTSAVNTTVYIASCNGLGTYQNGTFGMFILGPSLNTTEAGNLYTRVTNFQTALSR